MRRVSSTLRTDRPPSHEASTTIVVDGVSWGFHALDGLPDLEEASPYDATRGPASNPQRLSSGALPEGFDDELRDALAELWSGLEGRLPEGRRPLSVYETEVLDALVARRDAALRLQRVLADDIAQFPGGAAGVLAGHAMDFLVPSIGGTARRGMTDAVAEFEAARHRFRLALVAVGVDGGMSGADIGEALSFSRQLASRYLKEARSKWPALKEPETRRGRRR